MDVLRNARRIGSTLPAALVVALSAFVSSAIAQQDGGADDLRGANHVCARPVAKSKAPASRSRYRVTPDVVADWIARYDAPSETFELVGGGGSAYTRAERAAATNPARLLTASEPLPQLVHMLAAKPGDSMLARVVLRMRRT